MRMFAFSSISLAAISATVFAAEFHVTVHGGDHNPGTRELPLRTIQHAANLAQPGDVVTVHAGIYRESVRPPLGGVSDQKPIVYQAAAGEKVEIRGSEIVRNWRRVQNDVWKVTLPNSFFGSFNPYRDLIHGDWFEARGRAHHTGAVYLDGDWLIEAAQLAAVLDPGATLPLWFAEVDKDNTTIWARFKNVDPNAQLVEINVRRTVFFAEKPGINYITVRGFVLRHAATPWAPPTAEQIGLLGTLWSRGWIIENNVVSHSTCSGIALGKYGDEWDNTSANTAEGYVKTVERALRQGWNKETVGHHIIRDNHISQCEQAGIVGSLGAAFSTVTGNTIHDIHVRRLFSGAEMAGIKFHGAIDTTIRSNHIFRTCRGLWLDWMAQGTRVSGNLLHDNVAEDLFVEVNHGPFLVDNNLFLSAVSLLDMSEGGAYVHNLFRGKIISRPEPNRATPYHRAHSTTLAGLERIQGGDNRFYNNIFIGAGTSAENPDHPTGGKPPPSGGVGLWVYDGREQTLQAEGNAYYRGAKPSAQESHSSLRPAARGEVEVIDDRGQVTLRCNFDMASIPPVTRIVTSSLLGTARIPGLGYENPDGSPIRIDRDYFGKARSETNPFPGPFEARGDGLITLKVW